MRVVASKEENAICHTGREEAARRDEEEEQRQMMGMGMGKERERRSWTTTSHTLFTYTVPL